ncbi:hypothetical protein [Brucella pseudogrignonensis]|uniref:Uncharacterized protein n=1 Tax=Brucella pseudogrignonensis TaxID=419475 RepID=A0ABU1M4M4_9HYPH|nr:hypothetical protein [Brucella pseudogrignonensis]MDR6430997.1 hypothetical protein [Brucella pseudogrignonensis]
MKKFAVFDLEGFPLAFYAEDVHGSRTLPVYGEASEPSDDNPNYDLPIIGEKDNPDCLIPFDAIEISDDDWRVFINNAGYRKWDGSKVVEYTPPTPDPLTPEELRAQMPPLSRRQIWLGAHSLGMSKDDVKANTDDPEILIEIEEATEFHRTYESVVMMSSVMGITPEQLDDVWMWWASA